MSNKRACPFKTLDGASGEGEFSSISIENITIQSPQSVPTYTLTLPPNDGNAGQILSTNGSGVLTWVNDSVGTGTVTSVSVTVPSYQTVTVLNSTTTPTIQISGSGTGTGIVALQRQPFFTDFIGISSDYITNPGLAEVLKLRNDENIAQEIKVTFAKNAVTNEFGFYFDPANTANNYYYVTVQNKSLLFMGLANFTFPTTTGSAGQVLRTDGFGNSSWVNQNPGTVTSVSVTVPSYQTVTVLNSTTTPTIQISGSGTGTGIVALQRQPFFTDFIGISSDFITNPGLAEVLKLRNDENIAQEIKVTFAKNAVTNEFGFYFDPANTANNYYYVTVQNKSLLFMGLANFTFPTTTGSAGQVLITDGFGNTSWTSTGNGSVTSVSASVPSWLSVTVTNPTTTPAIAITGSSTGTGTVSVLQDSPTINNTLTVSDKIDIPRNSGNGEAIRIHNANTSFPATNYIVVGHNSSARNHAHFGHNIVSSGNTANYAYIETNGNRFVFNGAANFVLPLTTGTAGQALITDGAGNTSWTTLPTGTVTSVSGTSPINSSGGATPTISLSTVPTTLGGTGLTTVGTNGQVLTSNGTTLSWTTPSSGGVTSVSATAPLASSGGATPTISIANSTGTGWVVLDSSPTINTSVTVTEAGTGSVDGSIYNMLTAVTPNLVANTAITSFSAIKIGRSLTTANQSFGIAFGNINFGSDKGFIGHFQANGRPSNSGIRITPGSSIEFLSVSQFNSSVLLTADTNCYNNVLIRGVNTKIIMGTDITSAPTDVIQIGLSASGGTYSNGVYQMYAIGRRELQNEMGYLGFCHNTVAASRYVALAYRNQATRVQDTQIRITDGGFINFLHNNTVNMSLSAGGQLLVRSGILVGNGTSSPVQLLSAVTSGTYSITFPTSAGTNGQVLTTDGTGVLSWTTPTAGTVTSVAATSPLASSGGTTPTISIASSTGTGAVVLANTAAMTELTITGTPAANIYITSGTAGIGSVVNTSTLYLTQVGGGGSYVNQFIRAAYSVDNGYHISVNPSNDFLINAAKTVLSFGYIEGVDEFNAVTTFTQYNLIRSKGGVGVFGYKNGGNNDLELRFASVSTYGTPTIGMTLKSSGNVGIGTTTPGARLDVSGDGSVFIQRGVIDVYQDMYRNSTWQSRIAVFADNTWNFIKKTDGPINFASDGAVATRAANFYMPITVLDYINVSKGGTGVNTEINIVAGTTGSPSLANTATINFGTVGGGGGTVFTKITAKYNATYGYHHEHSSDTLVSLGPIVVDNAVRLRKAPSSSVYDLIFPSDAGTAGQYLISGGPGAAMYWGSGGGGGGGSVNSVTASAPLASSGGTAPNISIASATGSGAVVLAGGPQFIDGFSMISSGNDTVGPITTGNGQFLSIEAHNVLNNLKRPIVLNGYGGSVGIGTTSVTQRLEVVGNTQLTFDSTNNDGFRHFAANNTTHLVSLTRQTNDAAVSGFEGVRFIVNSTTAPNSGSVAMRINSSANVGIGTTSPAQRLHVSGTTRIDGAIIQSGGESTFSSGTYSDPIVGVSYNAKFGSTTGNGIAVRGNSWFTATLRADNFTTNNTDFLQYVTYDCPANDVWVLSGSPTTGAYGLICQQLSSGVTYNSRLMKVVQCGRQITVIFDIDFNYSAGGGTGIMVLRVPSGNGLTLRYGTAFVNDYGLTAQGVCNFPSNIAGIANPMTVAACNISYGTGFPVVLTPELGLLLTTSTDYVRFNNVFGQANQRIYGSITYMVY